MCIPATEPPSEQTASYLLVLRVIMILQLIIAVLDISADNYYVPHGIFGIFLAFILFITQRLLSHQLLLIQLLISLYFTTEFLFGVLVFFQNGVDLVSTTDALKYSFAVFVISFLYYLFVSIYCYYPYKNFKAVRYRQNPALQHIFERGP
jgi:hypothetical protein